MRNTELQGVSYFGYATYMNYGFVRSYVEIGRYCSIGRDVTIGSGAHDISFFTTSPFYEKYLVGTKESILKLASENPKRRVVIGNDVWVGDKTYIMSGVTIGDGAIIAAGTVVTKDVPSYSIVAGIPARVIRNRFSDEVISILVKSKWWVKHPLDISKAVTDASNHGLSDIQSILGRLESIESVFTIDYKKITA